MKENGQTQDVAQQKKKKTYISAIHPFSSDRPSMEYAPTKKNPSTSPLPQFSEWFTLKCNVHELLREHIKIHLLSC